MPELPEIELYVHALRQRVLHQPLERIRVGNPFVIRTYQPEVGELAGKMADDVGRLGKRIVLRFEEELFCVLHLMIAGRLQWREAGAAIPGKTGLLALDFRSGTLLLTEAGSKRQASVHIVRGAAGLGEHDRGGLEVLHAQRGEFAERLRRENHTLKRALTDPRLFSGIGNAHSDEILHAARLSPLRQTASLSDTEIDRLFSAARDVLQMWIARLRQETGDRFPQKVTAFHPQMAVHGKFGQPCPVCGSPIQRIVYARNEANYCAACQTGGRLLSDRALSRLLGRDWPKTLEELENRRSR